MWLFTSHLRITSQIHEDDMMAFIYLHVFIACFCFAFGSSVSDLLTNTQFLRDEDVLVSNNSNFKLGFFSLANSRNRYLGIWYNDKKDPLIPEVVWVANRDNPLTDSSGVFGVSDDGNLQVLDGDNKTLWSSNITHQGNSSVAQLLGTGNLVLLSEAGGTIIWQSFSHPTDSVLPLMKVSVEKDIGHPLLHSWKSASDPSSGRYRLGCLSDRQIFQLFIVDGDKPRWRSGPSNGYVFLGLPYMESDNFNGVSISFNPDGTVELSYNVPDPSIPDRFVLTYDGILLWRTWDYDHGNWESQWQSNELDCEVYAKCGPFGSCNSSNNPICSCLRGFVPKNIDEWNKGNWTDGCVRRTPLQCNTTEGKANGFARLNNVKVPDYGYLAQDAQGDCGNWCLANCSCLAYSYYSGIGCMIWDGILIDIQEFEIEAADLYLRLDTSELGNELQVPSLSPPSVGLEGKSRKNKVIKIVVLVTGLTCTALLIAFTWILIGKRAAKKKQIANRQGQVDKIEDLPLYELQKLVVATNNFSGNNKLGQGGFGSVYKGILENGQEIAVKRLSTTSMQGLEEFMNEVKVISNLQHRNLVRLLGCCIEGDEKLLVYEYMPLKSLDALLFHPDNREHLDWPKRYNIIGGIFRGLLYLHRDSRLKIIHRDLKPSNILLDDEFNPRISDFGMARIFGTKQDHGNTLRIVGTYGYMSPEYAMEGLFSEKSDVYSLGVLLLEIISGRTNTSFMQQKSLSLLAYAWKLWNENDILSLVDPTIVNPNNQGEILKCIKLGLLCVQELPEDRPSIPALIGMLDVTDAADLPHPKRPGFIHRQVFDGLSQSNQPNGSANQVTVSIITGR